MPRRRRLSAWSDFVGKGLVGLRRCHLVPRYWNRHGGVFFSGYVKIISQMDCNDCKEGSKYRKAGKEIPFCWRNNLQQSSVNEIYDISKYSRVSMLIRKMMC